MCGAAFFKSSVIYSLHVFYQKFENWTSVSLIPYVTIILFLLLGPMCLLFHTCCLFRTEEYKHDSMLTSIGRRGGCLSSIRKEDIRTFYLPFSTWSAFAVLLLLQHCVVPICFFILLRTTRHIPKAKGCWPIPVRWECVARDIYQPYKSLEKHSINDRFSSKV